jgi:hypothetical protein
LVQSSDECISVAMFETSQVAIMEIVDVSVVFLLTLEAAHSTSDDMLLRATEHIDRDAVAV